MLKHNPLCFQIQKFKIDRKLKLKHAKKVKNKEIYFNVLF